MNFTSDFLLNSLLASVFNLFFYCLPGYLIALLLNLPKRYHTETLLFAPALGMATFGPVLLVFCNLFGFGVWQVGIAWFVFNAIAFIWVKDTEQHFDLKVTFSYTLALIAVVFIGALFPALNLAPRIENGGLFVYEYIFDHMKIAFIDSMVRENLPPINPFYAPEGQRIELIYYYGWHFYAAVSKLLMNISSWQAEVAFTWFSTLAFITFPAAVAIRFTGRQVSGLLIGLLTMAGPPADILPYLVGPGWEHLLTYPNVHPLEVPWIQLTWAPQHVFSALCSFMLIFLLVHSFSNKSLVYQHAVIMGLIAAAGFSCSVWVGGVAQAMAAPFLILALWLAKADFSKLLKPTCLALVVCFLFALPVLLSVTSGESNHQSVLGLLPYWSTQLFDQTSKLKQFGHMLLYWIHFLPLSLGMIYIIGLFALFCYKPLQGETKRFYYLSLTATIIYLLIVQFIQSTIMNNDFGWRTVMVPNLFLMLWTSIALTEIPMKTPHWRSFAVKLQHYNIFLPLSGLAIVIGLLSTIRLTLHQESLIAAEQNDPVQMALHQDLFRQRLAWDKLRQITEPDDIVQNNPNTYATAITPWSAPVSMALMADRPTAYSDPESVNVFAHSYSMEQKIRQHQAIQAIFSAQARPEDLHYASQVLHIEALLVDARDPVWQSQIIEQSGFYRLQEQSPHFKIYKALKP